MVESNLDNDHSGGHIIVCPNLSANWRTTKWFILIVTVFTLMIGIGFAAAGLWMILPFAGIEVAVVVSVMYHVARQCYRQEVIHLKGDRVIVERGRRAPKQVWESEVFWTRLIVSNSLHTWHPDKLILRSRDRELEIGGFLNEQDKKKLVAEMRTVLAVID